VKARLGVTAALLLAFAAVVATIAATAAASRREPAATSAAARSLVKCGKTRLMGFMVPITGPAASIGRFQADWARYFVATYNRAHKAKLKLVVQDTMLGSPTGTAEALKGAQALGSNARVLGVVGPAGSNENIAVTKTLKDGGFGWITGSATRTSLTTDGTRRGFFFRTVPPDAIQGTTAANYILNTLKAKRVYIIDDQEAYSTGLADAVESRLKSAGVSVSRDGVSQQQSDFTSLIAKIPRDTQLVYLPWQLPPKGKAFGQQMKSAGKGSIKLMGADGLYDPDFAGVGTNVYDTNFPLNPKSGIIAKFRKSHGGDGEYFGAPTYAATQVMAAAVDKACKNGSASRAEVRKTIRKTFIRASKSLLGVNIRFNANGDLTTLRKFGIYKSNGKDFVPVG
jgi:branched-chain amino acid transport system substrate-binding protein